MHITYKQLWSQPSFMWSWFKIDTWEVFYRVHVVPILCMIVLYTGSCVVRIGSTAVRSNTDRSTGISRGTRTQCNTIKIQNIYLFSVVKWIILKTSPPTHTTHMIYCCNRVVNYHKQQSDIIRTNTLHKTYSKNTKHFSFSHKTTQ